MKKHNARLKTINAIRISSAYRDKESTEYIQGMLKDP